VTPPKSYSVDEMLTQLRAPDGLKRKRRSEQPVYTVRRRRRLLIGVLIGIILLALAGYFGFLLFQKLRLEGETFRQSLNRRVSDAVGCQVELVRIHDGGETSLSATDGRITTWDQDLIESGEFFEINASLTSTSFYSNEWGIKMLGINRGTIKLNPQRALVTGDTTKSLPRSPAREKSSDSGRFRFGINPDPDIITLDNIQFTKGLNLEWPSLLPGLKVEAIRGLRGSARLIGGGVMEGAFVDGTVTLNLLPEMKLDRLHWKLTGRRLEIIGARIGFGTGDAEAEISGNANLVSDGTVDLKVNIVSTPLKTLVPSVWHERVHGKFASSDATFHASFAKGPERVLEGDFTLTGAVLIGIGFVNKLAAILQRPEFSRLEFPELTGHFKWTPSGGVEITQLAGDKEGILRLAGGMTVNANGAISGRLKASVSESVLRSRQGDRPHPFGPATDGWASTEFTLSGTSTAIDDSLSLTGAPSASAVPKADPAPERTPAVLAPAPAPVPLAPSAPPRAPRASPPPSDAELEKKFEDLLRK